MINNFNKSDRISLLFVCLGNICRSPIAEGVFSHLLQEAGLEDRFICDSCGTSAHHKGSAPHLESQRVARQHGIDISKQQSRPVTKSDFSKFDLLVAMDRSNRYDLERLSPESAGKIICLREFEDGLVPKSDYLDVPDPYYGGSSGFDQVYDIIYCCSVNLLQYILKEKN